MESVAPCQLRSGLGRGERRRALLPAALVLAWAWATSGCAAPPCEPPETRCDEECVDLSTDPSHCGACGHACPAGPDELARCTAGVCYRATVLASSQGGPRGIAVDATHVYWASRTDGTVMKAPKSGGEATAVATGQLGAFNVAVDASHVYWSVICYSKWDDCVHAVRKAPLAGGSPTELATPAVAFSMAIDEHDVYYCDGGVWRVPKAGTEPPVSLEQPCLWSLSTDAQNLYVANWHDLVQIRLADQSNITLATSDAAIHSLAAGSTHVYWIQATQTLSNGQLSKVPIGGGEAVSLALAGGGYHPGFGCQTLTVDEAYAYWGARLSLDGPPFTWGRVLKASIHGGEATAIVDGFGHPTCLAADESHVYWTDEPDGLVLRAAK